MRFIIEPNHPSLPGHFPGRPIVPGVLVLERVLEAIEQAHGPLPALRLPQVKFVQPLLPGQRAEITLEAAGSGCWRFRVQHGDALLARGDVVAGDVRGVPA